MTAEVAILNRSAVALAADSALTVRRGNSKEKGWKNANKLFELSTSNDIGVMIFQTGDYCGIPWEIVLKEFRKRVGSTRFKKLDDAIADFTAFLGAFETPDNDIDQLNVLIIFLQSIGECAGACTDKGKVARRRQFAAKIDDLIEAAEEKSIILDTLTLPVFSAEHRGSIERFLKSESGVHTTNVIIQKMTRLCFERVRREHSSGFETGVVFAGYGETELLRHRDRVRSRGDGGWILDAEHRCQRALRGLLLHNHPSTRVL